MQNIDGGIDLVSPRSDRKGEVIYYRVAVLYLESGRCIISCFLLTPSLTFIALVV